MKENESDSVDEHVRDTINAGGGLCDPNVVRYISEVSDEVIHDLMSYGVNFDKDSRGDLNYTLEAAHSVKRILHVGGDATGKGIVDALVNSVKKNNNITVLENSIAVELLVNKTNDCKGVILYNSLTNEHEIVYSNATVLATGGVGQLYKYTTNPEGATGDGIDLAYNVGAELQDMEFIQFHPTALAISPNSKDRFLISEAVRGEGAKLVDKNGNEFMAKYHDKRELAPRDVVTRAIYNEMQVTNANNMYLNAFKLNADKLLSRFPTISKKCKDKGIDITRSPIPVAPAAHYFMGGIKVSVEGRTSVKGLYAIGETASTGLHGANRLASNSLLECVACAYELSDYLSFANLNTPKIIDSNIMKTIDTYSKPISDADYDIPKLKQSLKNLMWNNVGIIRDEEHLTYARKAITAMIENFARERKCFNVQEYEYRNMLTTAGLIVQGALTRRESRGAHTRSDYKNTDLIGKHSCFTKTDKELSYA